MDTIGIAFDTTKFVAAVGLAYFVRYLYRHVFRGGMMAPGFRMIGLSLVFLCVGRLAGLLASLLGVYGTPLRNIDDLLGTAFAITNAYGFYLIYKVWRVAEEKPSRKLDLGV